LLARSQNRWPSLRYDFLSVNQWFAPFLVAGFYYKTFKWPASFWEPVYERIIRRAAGLGRVAEQNDPDHYERAHLHCDLLIIGGGVTGLMAAKAAAGAGLRVVLADDGTRFGGQALGETATRIDTMPAGTWIEETVAALAAADNVTLLDQTTVFGRYDAGSYGALQICDSAAAVPAAFTPRQVYWRIHTRRAILAAGATERPIVIAGNDRPGVMLAGAARTYANRYGVKCGDRVVVFGNSDDIYQTALDLEATGAQVAVVVDARPASDVARTAGRQLAARVRFGSVIEAIHGDKRVTSVDVRNVDTSAGQAGETVSCDTVCLSGGWNANFHLATHRGLPAHFDPDLHSFKTAKTDDELTVAGAAQCHWSTSACLADGLQAARQAITLLNGAPVSVQAPPATDGLSGNLTPLHRVPGKADKAFVDFQHDVTDTDLGLAVREGYDHAEHAKRYTTLGMATDQGKMGHVNGAALLAEARGKRPEEVGTSRARPPVSPVTIGALAGHGAGKGFMPARLTPMHDWHARHQATFVEAGLWYRPQFYRQPGEETWLDSAKREAKAVRGSVGISDVSSLGKIDIQGADAATFINRVYSNNWLKLPVGKARYGLMLREDGFVMDDGTTARLGETHYIMTTTTVNAGAVMAH
ncbi:MAG: FAD-dependent oxidoreductase, partial [Pseudomonadota bacterium]